jgi:Protein of unknown function (DUF1549)/Protein of unknown function (DUF1553)
MNRHSPSPRCLLGLCPFAVRLLVVIAAVFLPGACGEGFAADSAPDSADAWWSLRPLERPVIPSGKAPGTHPVDAFIRERLSAEGLAPSPEADRRTLIRRLSFDLTGLPPSPEEIESFLADAHPQAYERLVDRWLASPRYGERWARHWLDVVHYGETHGYDKDQPRPNAWPYRDYVIRALNEDRPYARFVQEQVAGDVLFPNSRDGFEALGFVAAGPWDLIGHAEVPESKMDGQVARHLDRDDMVANTLQTFTSLTVQCAQCHNHKFDPIPQEDYYRLQAVFAAVDRADQKYDIDPEVARERRILMDREGAVVERRRTLEEAVRGRVGVPLVKLEEAIALREKSLKNGGDGGYHSQIEKKQELAKWVQVDLGRSVPLGSVVLHPCRDDFNGIGEGFGFPVRFRVESADSDSFRNPVVIADHSAEDFPNPRLKPFTIDLGGRSARFIRVTALKLAPRQDDFIFALAEVSAIGGDGTNVARGSQVTALDSIEAPDRWQRVNLTDGAYPGMTAASDAVIATLKKERADLIAGATREEERLTLESVAVEQAELKRLLDRLPPRSTAYVASVHTGSGAFTGTGAKGGRPRTIHLLNRGSLQKPGREVEPGALRCVPNLPASFDLPENHREGERRAALARWLTDSRNSLTWRSIVNRVWQYHFGRGLVETPNDFGHMGALPSHPELLDWLAVEFRDGGQSLKALHRLILTSDTYRQASAGRPDAERVDSGNRLLWRMNRRKLEAEAVRDSILSVAGRLDLRMGGPSFRDFVVDKPEHSPHYEYGLHDAGDPASHRRSVYRWIVRSQQQPFLTTLDCADPSMQVARRNESTSPLQALAVLNNSLVIAMSREFASRTLAGGGDTADQVRRAHREALGRLPSGTDEAALVAYTREFGLTNYCRVLYNLNEFSFVD